MKRRTSVNRYLMILVVGVLAATPATWAAASRISGTVHDPAGNPIEGVQVTVSAREVQLVRQAESNKKGKFTIVLLDSSRNFDIRLEKEGFQPIVEPFKPRIGGVVKKTWVMTPGAAPAAPEQLAEVERRDGGKLYNQGVRAFGEGEFDVAADLFAQALEQNPDLGPAHQALARIHVAQDEYAEALPHAERAAELMADDEVSQVVLFDSLWGVGEYERGLEVLDRMVAEGRSPDKTSVRVFNAGVRAVRDNDLDAAKARFEQSLELDPALDAAHLPLAQIALAKQEFESGVSHAEAFLESNPEDPRGLSALYQAYLALERSEEADAVFQRLVAADPGRVAETFYEEGVTHFNSGRNADAIAALERVLSADPDHARAMYMLGLAYASGGDLEKAKANLNRFLELAPDDPQAETARQMLAGLE